MPIFNTNVEELVGVLSLSGRVRSGVGDRRENFASSKISTLELELITLTSPIFTNQIGGDLC